MALHRLGDGGGKRCGDANVTDPDQHVAILVHGDALGVDELLLQIVEDSSSRWNWRLQGTIRHSPSPSEEVKDICRAARKSPSPPLHLRQRRLRLGQPERHVHGAVQLDGGGQFRAGWLSTVYLGIQGAKAEVAVGLERAHAEFLG